MSTMEWWVVPLCEHLYNGPLVLEGRGGEDSEEMGINNIQPLFLLLGSSKILPDTYVVVGLTAFTSFWCDFTAAVVFFTAALGACLG